MRKHIRPFVVCGNCGAKLHCSYWSDFPEPSAADLVIRAGWPEPPRVEEECPNCKSRVDTTCAYPAIPGFPPSFEQLKAAYNDFSPRWEYHRASFEEEVGKKLDEGATLKDWQDYFNSTEGLDWYRQRLFYRSATGFYRMVELFLAFLTLGRRCHYTWGDVTAYYSRFYFIQSFLNLTMSTYLNLGKKKALIFLDGSHVVCRPPDNLPMFARNGSHEMWWALMEAMKTPDYPCEQLEFVLTRLVFNPTQRQEANYDYDYFAGGFPELNGFDSGWEYMRSHFVPHPRRDADITDIGRFFGNRDPGECDEADFMGDDSQIIWCSLKTYLELLKALGVRQDFIRTDNIVWLSHLHIGTEYPDLLQGIAQSVAELLDDGFDLTGFRDHPNEFFNSMRSDH